MTVKAKRVSNYELFYDLVFVLATGSLVNMLHGGDHHQDIGWYELMQFIIAIISLWNVWFMQNFYLNRYSRRDGNDIYTIIASMLIIGNAVITLASDWRTQVLTVNGIEVSGVIFFNGLLILAYGVIILQYLLHSRRYNIWTRDMKLQVALLWMMMGILVLTSIITLMLPEQYGAFVFLVAYAIILIVPFALRKKADASLVNFPHMVERMQLITILTFGETVIAVIRTYTLATNALVAICAFAMVGFLFMMYISQTAIGIEHHQNASATVLLYAHIGVLVAIDFITAGSEMVEGTHLTPAGLGMLLFGIGAFYACLFTTSVYNKEGLEITKAMLVTYIAIYLVGVCLALYTQGELWMVYLVLAAMNYLMVYVNWRHRREWIQKNIEF